MDERPRRTRWRGSMARCTSRISRIAISSSKPSREPTAQERDLREARRHLPAHALLASNTCRATSRDGRRHEAAGAVLGLHFFNPVPLMKLVEVVQSILTDDATVAALRVGAGRRQGPVKTKDSTAFIVNGCSCLSPRRRRVYEAVSPRSRTSTRHEARLRLPDGAFTLLDWSAGHDMFVAR